MTKKKTTKTTMTPVANLADLRRRAQVDASYRRLALIAAENLGGDPREDLDKALRWLRMNALEVDTERGDGRGERLVVDEVNSWLRRVERENERGDEIVTD
jgi:hypothetical protein